MPIPVINHEIHNKDRSNDILQQSNNIQFTYLSIIRNILDSRFSNQLNTEQHNLCLNQDQDHYCINQFQFKNAFIINLLKDYNSHSISLNILEKQSNSLLERWVISFDSSHCHSYFHNNNVEHLTFIQSINNFTATLPLSNNSISSSSLYLISSFFNQTNEQCHSYLSNQIDTIEFKSTAQLKAQQFQLSNYLSLKVVYDQSLSTLNNYSIIKHQQNPSLNNFLSWPKIQLNNNNNNIHQLEQNSYLIKNEKNNQSFNTILDKKEISIPNVQNNLHYPIHNSTVPNSVVHNGFNSVHTPFVSIRKLSRLSLSAMESEQEDTLNNYRSLNRNQQVHPHLQTINEHINFIPPAQQEDTFSSFSIPIPPTSSKVQYTRYSSYMNRRTVLAYSTSPTNPRVPFSHPFVLPSEDNNRKCSLIEHHGCLVGSFEESLFSGRMSSMPSKPIMFHCQIGVLGYGACKPALKCPPHWSILFPATFYNLPQTDQEETPVTPYVGTVDICEYTLNILKKPSQPGYRIPPKGQLQVVVKNPNKTAVKLFLIPYDFTDMPRNTKTFLRQKSYTQGGKKLLRYAIHIQVCRTEKNRIYLYKSVKIIFTNQKVDAHEKFDILCEGPQEPIYIPL